MTDFQWIGDSSILYKGRIVSLTEHDGWEVVNAMQRVDEEERQQTERIIRKILCEKERKEK